MKISIASNDGERIAAHFGRTRGFIIFEIEDGKIIKRDYIENTFTGHALGMEGHGGHHHGDILTALGDCQAVISRGMGQRMYQNFRNNGIKAFIVNEESADEAVKNFIENKLEDNPDKSCNH